MIKNDYRREMILLRPLEDGFSGFCRIETRVSRGSITYNIRASHGAGRLYAVLVGARGGRWQTAIGGEIRADALGQAGFYWELDPRSIDGLALENYALVGVATDGADAHLVLAGKQDKGKQVDWAAVEQSVHDAFAADDMETAEPAEADTSASQTAEPESIDEASEQAETTESTEQDSAIDECGCLGLKPCELTQNAADESVQADESTAAAEQDAMTRTADDCDCLGLKPCETATSDASEQTDDAASSDDDLAVQNAAGAREQPEQPETAEERSHMIRVLGASIAGEKDSELSDEQLSKLIESTLRGMLKKLGACGDSSETGDSAKTESATSPSLETTAAKAGTEAQPETEKSADEQTATSIETPTENASSQAETYEYYYSDPAETVAEDAAVDALIDESELTEAAQEPTEQDTGSMQKWLLEGQCSQERAWPENCAELKRLFQNAVRAYPVDAPGFIFVRAPMAGGGDCAVGVKCEDGLPSEVMYLIPGRYSAEPPAGLEGYAWREGAGGGFWMARQDAYTGVMLFDK